MKEKTDYEKDWPKLVPQFCDDEIAKHQKRLDSGAVPKQRKDTIEAKISVLKRIRDEYASRAGT